MDLFDHNSDLSICVSAGKNGCTIRPSVGFFFLGSKVGTPFNGGGQEDVFLKTFLARGS